MFPVINLKETGINLPTIDNLYALSQGRVPGAELVGNRWFLPLDAVKPQDPRKMRK